MTDFNDFNAKIIAEFRANAGKVGGNFKNAPMVLITTRGARSGKERVNPLVYLPDGERVVIFASKAGAASHPAWYHNLRAHPEITVEVGAQTYRARATVLEGEERDRLFAEQARRMPVFSDYQARTTRSIPVIALERVS